MYDHMNPNRKAIKKNSGNRDPAYAIQEGDVLKAVSEWLDLHHIPHWRINSGALETPRGRVVRFGAKGMADFFAMGPAPEGKAIWIECKRLRGGVVSAAQQEFLDCINRYGGIGIIVSSIESLEIQLKEAGIFSEILRPGKNKGTNQ
jgi:hypothetical protein